jgi:hypothetical protein
VSEDAGIEHRTVATLTLAAYLLSSKYKFQTLQPLWLDLIHNSAIDPHLMILISAWKNEKEKSRRKRS